MKKTLRTVVASLLLLVMLFSVSVTTIFAAEDLSSIGSGSTGSLDPITPPTESSGNSLQLGWINVGYDDDSIDIVWNPWFNSMLETMIESPEKIQELSAILTEGIEHLVLDSLKEGMAGGTGSDPNAPVINLANIDDLWNIALDAYLSKPENVAEFGSDKTLAALAFFKEILNEDMSAEASRASNFTNYVCGLVRLAVTSGEISLDNLKAKFANGSDLKNKLDDQIHDKIAEYAKDFMIKEVEGYIAALQELEAGETLTLDEVQKLVQNAAVEHARGEVIRYLNGRHLNEEITDFDVQISDFIAKESKKIVSTVLGDYAAIKKGTKSRYTAGSPEDYAYLEVDEYVKRAVDNYVKALCGVAIAEAEKTLLDGKFKTELDSMLKTALENEFDDVVKYLKNEITTAPDTYDIFKAKIESDFGVAIEDVPVSEIEQKKADVVANVSENLTSNDYDAIKDVLGDADALISELDETKLNSIIETVDLDEVAEIVRASLDNDALKTVANSVSSDKIVSFLTELVQTNGFDTAKLIASVEEKFDTITDDQYNTAYNQLLGVDKDTVEANLVDFEEIIADGYDATLQDLELSTELDMSDLLTYLQSITVNGKAICTFDGTSVKFNAAAVKSLMQEIPMPEDIVNMKDDDMKLEFAVNIVTDFSTANFNINLSVGSGYSDVRRIAAALCELIQVSRDDGKITLNIDFFDNIYDVLCDFATSDKMSPELRSELFGLMNLSFEELYDYVSDINGLTFKKYKSIVSAIDFEKVLENFGIDDVKNEQFVELLCKDEEKFEEIRGKLLDRFASVPESLKSKTIFSLYDGNGKFSYSNSLTLSVRDVIAKLEGIAPGLKNFTAILKGAVGNKTFEADVEVNVNVPKLYSVTYVVTDPDTNEIITKTGLLPEGISTRGFFSPVEEYDGKAVDRYNGFVIEKWSLTQDGEPVEAIIAEDGVVLYATLEKVKTAVTVYDNLGYVVNGEVVYDVNKSYVIEAALVYSQNTHTPELKYQWYKGTELLEGETEKTLELIGEVKDSGEYWCKITIVSDGEIKNFTTNSVSAVLTVNPKPVNIADYGLEWNYDSNSPFVYDGSFHNVTLIPDTLIGANNKGLPSIRQASYTNIEKVNAGVYTARANFVFVNDADNSNYEFLNSDGTQSSAGFVECVWEIKPQEIVSTEDFVWSAEEGAKFTYEYGKIYSVTLSLPEKLTVESYTNDAATYAGSYTTTAKIKSNDPNYVWAGTNPTLNWSIEKALFDLANVTWSYNAEEPFVYNGEEQSVFVSEVPEDIVWLYTDNVQIGAGDYVASAEPDPNNALNSQNYVFKGKVSDCEWSIGKQTVETLLELVWNYTEVFTYNGETHTVELTLPEAFDDRIVVNYTNNSATDAGKYTATAELVALDSDNFEVVGEENKIKFECEWVINKAIADVSGISFKDKTVYYTGEAFGIEIEGTLPFGVSVAYSDAVSEVGTYEMTATFVYNENNFEPIAPMTATLNILPVYPIVNEFASTDSSGNVIVDIKAQHGIPSNYQLNVKDLSVQYYGYDFGNLFGYGTNGDVISVYDIHFAENGTETPFNDVFSVRMLLPANFNGDINNVRVVHIAENGELTDMEAMINGDYVTFETIHFSIYAIVEVVERVEKAEEFDFYSLIPYGIALLVVIILLIIIIVVIKKKRKKNKPEEPESKEEPNPEEPEPEEPKPEAEAEAKSEPQAEEPVEEKPAIVIHESVEEIPAEPSSDDSEAALPPGEIVHVRCRSSFMSRLIQSEPPIQDYYTILKNALLSYKGVKARMSFNFESFNSGRVQCAKLNVKGKSFLVYLGLDLEEYNVNKYHFTDASDKPKFEKVPMMLKVKSDRSLKYALELIDEVMKKNGFEKDPKFQEEDYHMPYETTAALAEKELVKLILPQGVSLADGIKLVKMDVGALLDEAKTGDDDED